MQIFDPATGIVAILAGVILSSLIGGLCLRYVYRNSDHLFVGVMIIILGSFGVFCTLFAWSYIFSHVDSFLPIGARMTILGLVVLLPIAIGFVTTSGFNRTNKKNGSG
ncbi:MAG: hypothetical protein ACFFF9_02225 [Candidatus Thorarchaeota archaeon]